VTEQHKTRARVTEPHLRATIDDALTNVSGHNNDIIYVNPHASAGGTEIDLLVAEVKQVSGHISKRNWNEASWVFGQSKAASKVRGGNRATQGAFSIGPEAVRWRAIPTRAGELRGVSPVDQLRVEISELRADIRALTDAVRNLCLASERETELRAVSKEEARAEVVELLSKGAELYPSDIANDLGLDYVLVREVLDDLAKDGLISYPSR
jgi:hypothetical protein